MSTTHGFRGRASSGQPRWRAQWPGIAALAAVVGMMVTLAAQRASAPHRPATVNADRQAATPHAAAPLAATPTASAATATPTPARLTLTRVPRNLPVEEQLQFVTGRSFFEDSWVRPGATTTLRDGLGPLFSARSCAACHQGAGRSSITHKSTFAAVSPHALTLRFDDQDPAAQPGQLPLGTTWQAFANPAARQPDKPSMEGELQARASERRWQYPDGTQVSLLQPEYRLQGAPASPGALSVRVAPGLDLAGRIAAVSTAAILGGADPDDGDGDGISGRIHPQVAALGTGEAGRFGLKARHTGLRAQVAAALQEDIGITSSVFPYESCGPAQTGCLLAPNGRGASVGGLPADDPSPVYEISDANLTALVNFLARLADPSATEPLRSEPASQGAELFVASGCAQCHVRSLATDPSAGAGASVVLYSDLLLHDMGADLADTGPAAGQLGREWRTAPLANLRWRARLSDEENYLHDGRARTVEEAVLWHGGEAAGARQRFAALPRADRQTLLDYVSSR